LRNLKEQIVREVERKGMQDNIKLGPGGIREIEFIVQAFQLVRGGRQELLQQRGVLDVLDALAVLGYLPAHVSLQLAEAYVFLRRVENRLQAYADLQVHELPDDNPGRARLAYAMGFDDWDRFARQLGEYRQLVQEHFEQVFAEPGTRTPEADGGVTGDLDAVWNDLLDRTEALATLAGAGYHDADETLAWLAGFRQGPVTRFLGDVGRQRLDQLMPTLLGAAASQPQPLLTLKRVGELLEAIAGRTAYLSLLVESPIALTQLVQLCSASAWVASQLAQYPILHWMTWSNKWTGCVSSGRPRCCTSQRPTSFRRCPSPPWQIISRRLPRWSLKRYCNWHGAISWNAMASRAICCVASSARRDSASSAMASWVAGNWVTDPIWTWYSCMTVPGTSSTPPGRRCWITMNSSPG
jgi:hypothetical protein